MRSETRPTTMHSPSTDGSCARPARRQEVSRSTRRDLGEPVLGTEGLGDRLRHESGVSEGGKPDPEDPCLVGGNEARRGLEREPRLARPGSRQGEQASAHIAERAAPRDSLVARAGDPRSGHRSPSPASRQLPGSGYVPRTGAQGPCGFAGGARPHAAREGQRAPPPGKTRRRLPPGGRAPVVALGLAQEEGRHFLEGVLGDGSDGTRTRDLRRDSPAVASLVPWSRNTVAGSDGTTTT